MWSGASFGMVVLSVCSIKLGMDQKTGLGMKDVVTTAQDVKASSQPAWAVQQSGETEEGHEQQGSEEISDKGNPDPKVVTWLSYIADLSAWTLSENDPSVVHKFSKEVTQPPEAEARELSEHQQDLFDRAKETLTSEQAAWMKKALLQVTDVFVKTDLGSGQFTALVQYLKTGQAFAFKQSMRRTPLCFEKQENAISNQMLSAAAIEHSHGCISFASY